MIQSDFAEAFDLSSNMKRFDRYLNAHSTKWSKEQRADLIRALLTPFAELHGMGMARRDIDCHNLWYSARQCDIGKLWILRRIHT